MVSGSWYLEIGSPWLLFSALSIVGLNPLEIKEALALSDGGLYPLLNSVW